MANLENIIAQKSQKDEQWKAQRQAERENIVEMQDAGITEITTNPEAYVRYLEMQGDNPTYSAGNIALAMLQNPEVTQFGTKDRWKSLGRSIVDAEVNKGIKIFSRSSFGKGYVLADAYDVGQTYGRELKQTVLQDDSLEMSVALTTLLNYSVVPVVVDREIRAPAFYDDQNMELAIHPDHSDTEAFPVIATEIALARFHAKGINQNYNRSECRLDAESVSYILCKRFGVEREIPELSNLEMLYEGWTAQERRQALDSIQDMSKQIGGSIERGITPQQRSRNNVHRQGR